MKSLESPRALFCIFDPGRRPIRLVAPTVLEQDRTTLSASSHVAQNDPKMMFFGPGSMSANTRLSKAGASQTDIMFVKIARSARIQAFSDLP